MWRCVRVYLSSTSRSSTPEVAAVVTHWPSSLYTGWKALHALVDTDPSPGSPLVPPAWSDLRWERTRFSAVLGRALSRSPPCPCDGAIFDEEEIRSARAASAAVRRRYHSGIFLILRTEFAECNTQQRHWTFAECNTRQSTYNTWHQRRFLRSVYAIYLPSTYFFALGKVVFHVFAKYEWKRTRQSFFSCLCRTRAQPCCVCQVLHSANTLPIVFWPLPSALGTGQSSKIQ